MEWLIYNSFIISLSTQLDLVHVRCDAILVLRCIANVPGHHRRVAREAGLAHSALVGEYKSHSETFGTIGQKGIPLSRYN